MACGKPLLVSDIAELRDVVERGAGIAFRTGDPESLADAMTALVARDDLVQMGERARNWVKQDTWDTIALRFEAALGAALERGERE